jgi:hypothetical protein
VQNYELQKNFKAMWGKKKQENRQQTKNSPRMETSGTEKTTSKAKKIKIPKVRVKFGFLRKISSLVDGSFLMSDFVAKNVPFLLFMVLLALLYIGNNYVAQSKVRKIEQINRELKDLRDEHISSKSELMYFTKKSEVAKKLESRKIKEATKPPFKIYTKKEDK